MGSHVDPSNLSAAMRIALLMLAGDPAPPRYRRNPRATATMAALERRRLIEWEKTDQHTGWKLTDKGGFFVAWFRAQPTDGGSSHAN